MNTDVDTIEMLRDSVARYAAERCNFMQRRAALGDPHGHGLRAWHDYAQFGWLALRMPEAEGGIDADARAIGAVMELVGEHLLMEPILASAVVATGLILKAASAPQRVALLPRLANGSLRLAFACDDEPHDGIARGCVLRGDRLSGGKIGVLHGDVADQLIVSAREGDTDGAWALCIVDASADGVQRRPYRMVDDRGAANVRFDSVRVERLGSGDAAAVIDEARDEAVVASCAEALGVVRSLVRKTCEYLKVRKQFGKTIGSNQALQHRMVDMFLLQEDMRALTQAAQRSLGGPAAERARIVSGARAHGCAAARRVANEAVQMHGGLGITDELDISHYFRRVMVINALFGSRDEHFARFVDRSLAA